MTRRHEQDALAGIRGAAASLAALASQITDAVAEAGATDKLTAGLVHVNTQRAALACLSLAAHAGRLEGLASAHAEALAAERAGLEAEAVRDARLYREDKAESPDTDYTPEAWGRDAFADSWEEGGALDREGAWACYWAAFTVALADE